MAEIRLITLDLDDTLWPCAPVIHAAERQLYRWLQQHAPAVTAVHDIESMRAHRQALAKAQPALGHDVTALRLTQLQQLLIEQGCDVSLAQRGADHFRAARNQVQPYDEVVAALHLLRQDYVLVSLTNGNAQLEHTPLAGCFHHSLNAGDVGAAKPDPAMFLAACDWADVPPQAALHVGDDPRRDIEAARALGMRTAWINRAAQDWPAELLPADQAFMDLTALTASLLGSSKGVVHDH